MSGTSRPRGGALTALCLLWLPLGRAFAVDAAVFRLLGQAQAEDPRPVGTGKAGRAPIALLRAELGRSDPGHGGDGSSAGYKDVSMLGTADYGVLELPVLSSRGAVFAMAGRAPVKVILSPIATAPETSACSGCQFQALPPHRIEMSLTGGAGVRFKLNGWSLHVGYGRFGAGSGEHRFVSMGLARSVF